MMNTAHGWNCVEEHAGDACYLSWMPTTKDLPGIADAMDSYIDRGGTVTGSSNSRLVGSSGKNPRYQASDDDSIEASEGEGILGMLIISHQRGPTREGGLVGVLENISKNSNRLGGSELSNSSCKIN